MIKYLARLLYQAYQPTGRLYLAPLAALGIAGGVQLLSNVLPRIVGGGKREARIEKAGKTFSTPDVFKQNVVDAEAQVNTGDPNTSRNLQAIKTGEANALAATKNTSGSVTDILAMLQGLNRTSTDQQLRTNAADTQFRLNARRYLSQARAVAGQAKMQTDRQNFAAQNAEIQRQQQNIQGWAQAGANVGNDIVGATLLKDYKFLGSGGTS